MKNLLLWILKNHFFIKYKNTFQNIHNAFYITFFFIVEELTGRLELDI